MFAVTGVRDQSDLDYGEAGNFDGGHHDGLRGEILDVLANHSPGLSGMSIIVLCRLVVLLLQQTAE